MRALSNPTKGPMNDEVGVFETLQATIADRQGDDPSKSYTASLLAGGFDKMTGKVTEEAGEVVEAALAEPFDRAHFVHEIADLVYHLLVTMSAHNVTLSDVEAELTRRHGTSGHVEKANRT